MIRLANLLFEHENVGSLELVEQIYGHTEALQDLLSPTRDVLEELVPHDILPFTTATIGSNIWQLQDVLDELSNTLKELESGKTVHLDEKIRWDARNLGMRIQQDAAQVYKAIKDEHKDKLYGLGRELVRLAEEIAYQGISLSDAINEVIIRIEFGEF